MLVLNRKCDQEILIDGDIRIRILSIKGNSVRLGIEAPGEVSILRGELVVEELRDFSEAPILSTNGETPPAARQGLLLPPVDTAERSITNPTRL